MNAIVNNAGNTQAKIYESVNEKDFNEVFNVNAKSVYYCAKSFYQR